MDPGDWEPYFSASLPLIFPVDAHTSSATQATHDSPAGIFARKIFPKCARLKKIARKLGKNQIAKKKITNPTVWSGPICASRSRNPDNFCSRFDNMVYDSLMIGVIYSLIDQHFCSTCTIYFLTIYFYFSAYSILSHCHFEICCSPLFIRRQYQTLQAPIANAKTEIQARAKRLSPLKTGSSQP